MPEILAPMLSIRLPPHNAKIQLSSRKSLNSLSAQPNMKYTYEGKIKA